MKLVFASNNKHKIAEIQQLVGDKFQILSLEAIGCTEDIPETADTIEGNAILKADYITKHYNMPCFADDTGLEIEALHGEPGVYSARYAGSQRNSEDNMGLVLANLRNETNRAAQFKTIIALHLGQEQYVFEGIVKGQITLEKRGENGFGYDPIFQPEDYTKTFAQMTLEEKAAISHRARAVVKLIDFLERMF
ncbi:non-canonical purine NTP diphosphatase [Flavobacterium sp. 20NA77.7]|uniref:dITP/XTP pyrophosphatase n=1 Tax=Flavobacterium nakdongensis TaxID=3073563 RepID=A0ABY9R7S6_9FLAO|nr:non-canonical purine NTP diphosphatase [Flavobacterium sp. 20NA77.7]WMW77297.1 non-canonical purine NTP diphosphatase [Flavobacterium sp. 20NA77.7]